jgi:hypothetical protein
MVLSVQERQASPSHGRASHQAVKGKYRNWTAFAADRTYADPEAAARKLVEITNSVDAVQGGRIYIELINGPMLLGHKATPAEYGAGPKLAIDRGWRCMRAGPARNLRANCRC